MVYKLKTDAETRAHVQLLMNFKGMRTENVFNKVNISRSSLHPIVKAQTITGRVRIDTWWGYSLAGHGNMERWCGAVVTAFNIETTEK